MQCPACGSNDTKVIESRSGVGGRSRKRRCSECGHPFSTIEHVTTDSLKVRKRDGRQQDFSRAKLVRGITKAAHLHALPPADVDAFVGRVIGMLQPRAAGAPVASTEIGQLVLEALQDSRAITDVARIRYALVFLGQRGRASRSHGFEDFLHWLEDAYGPPDTDAAPRTPWRVIKRDERVEAFEPAKLQRSLEIALKGRGSTERVHEQAGRIALDVSEALRGQALVTSQQIAAEVVKLLLQRDPIAYLRYASVMKRYRSAADVWVDALVLTHDELGR